MMNWEDGRLFLSVARAGQMLGAAKTLGLNQATLSRRMASLEKDLGVRLLVRRTTGCELTDEGRDLTATLERIESDFIASEARMHNRDSELSGTVRIGAPDGFGVGFLASRLVDLASQHPNLSLQLVPVPRTFSLSQREADVAIMIGRPVEGRLVARKLTDYTLSLYASRDYLRNHPPIAAPTDLSGHRLVTYVEDLIFTPGIDYAREFAARWKNTIEISSATGQIEAVVSGAGVGILHDYLAKDHPELELLLPERRIERSYWTVFHENMRGMARVRAVADFLAEAVKAAAPSFARTLQRPGIR